MSEIVSITWRERPIQIELAWVGLPRDATPAPPTVIFLHEGLGSVSMWKDFPERLCVALGARGLVYSRPGYGRSTPRPVDAAPEVDFVHQQAHEVLPVLLKAVGLDTSTCRPWLFGHSDGGSISLLFAARFPDQVAGVIALAPHIRVEAISLASIEQAREVYRSTDLRERLARYHDDPDSAFRTWNGAWLHPPFRDWSIEEDIRRITCPLLAIQGEDDEYGTMEQIRGIARRVPQTRLLELAACGHSPHKDQAAAVIDATRRFMASSS